MAVLTKNQCRAIVYGLLLQEGWLPSGTTRENWGRVTIAELQLDDPPLPGAPDFQKKRLAVELQAAFLRLGGNLRSPLSELKRGEETLAGLARWCHGNQP
jgi:hypothetical protein